MNLTIGRVITTNILKLWKELRVLKLLLRNGLLLDFVFISIQMIGWISFAIIDYFDFVILAALVVVEPAMVGVVVV